MMGEKQRYKGDHKYQDKVVLYHKLVEDIHRERYRRYMLWELLSHSFLLLFMGLFFRFTSLQSKMIYSEQSIANTLLHSEFPDNTPGTEPFIRFDQITDEAGIAQYASNVLYSLMIASPEDNPNLLLWGIRFRKIMMNPKTCVWNIDYPFAPSAFENFCNPAFVESQLYREPGCYPYVMNTGAPQIRDMFHSFPSEGYVYDLLFPTSSETCATETEEHTCVISGGDYPLDYQLYQLFDLSTTNPNPFLSRGTVALIVSMTFYNPSVGVLSYAQLLFNIVSSGKVFTSASIVAAGTAQKFSASGFNGGNFAISIILLIFIIVRILMIPNHLVLARHHMQKRSKFLMNLVIEVTLGLLLLTVIVYAGPMYEWYYQGTLTDEFQQSLLTEKAYDVIRLENAFRNCALLALIYCEFYFFKFFSLFMGPRFLYFVFLAAGREIFWIFVFLFLVSLAFSVYLALTMGAYTGDFKNVVTSFSSLFHSYAGIDVVSYSNPNTLNSDTYSTAMYLIFVIMYMIFFGIFFLNMYPSILISAFGRVFNLSLNKTMDESSTTRIGDAINLKTALERWFSDIATSFKRAPPDSEKVRPNTCKMIFCMNRKQYEKLFLSEREVLRRLAVWKTRQKNKEKKYMTYKELKDCLRGDPSEYKFVDCHQLDYLFSITLTITLASAVEMEAEIDTLSFKEFIATRKEDASKGGEVTLQELFTLYKSLLDIRGRENESMHEILEDFETSIVHTKETIKKIDILSDKIVP